MAFDVEGARKAGYTDAEIAAHMAAKAGFDLAGAKSAGYSDGDVIAHLVKMPNTSGIPGAEEEAARVAAQKAKPQPGMLDKALGVGEAALSTVTGAIGGGLGMVGGALGGLAGAVSTGKIGTKEGADLVEQAAAEGAAKLTYQPRTEAGQGYTEAIGQAMQQVLPVAALTPQLAGIRASAAPAVRAVQDAGAAGVARGAQMAPAAVQAVAQAPQRLAAAVGRQPEARPTPGTMGSVGAAGTDMATIRRANAEQLGFTGDAALTRGQASRDPAQIKFEVETAKNPELGGPLRDRVVKQNQVIYENFDVWADQTGAQAPTLRAVGAAVDRALVEKATKAKTEIRARYKAAEKAGEMETPVLLDSVVRHLNESAPDAAVAPLLTTARARALQVGIAAEGPDGALVPRAVPLKTAETYRQAIGAATDYTPTNVRQAAIIKGLVDETTEGLGGGLYRQARAARARYAQEFEDRAVISKLLNTKRGTEDRMVALEDVHKHSILAGSLDDVRAVRKVLQTAGADGQQAWRELQGATLRHIRDKASESVATDSAGRRVLSPAALDRVIRDMDADGKLDFVFGKKGAQQLRDLRELAQYVKTVPPESAINTSNTAATMAAFADVAFSGISGIPAPVATLSRMGLRHIKDKALRRRIADALDEADQAAAKQQKTRVPFRTPRPADMPDGEPPTTIH